MKKLFIFLFLSTALSWHVRAKQVDERTACTVAGNFFASRIGINHLQALPTPVLVCTSNDLKTGQDAKTKAAPAFYVFNFTSPQGFVIVSGDDACTPILGYSLDRSFQTGNIPPALSWWLQDYEKQIRESAEKELNATPETEAEWTAMRSDKSNPSVSQKSSTVVEPLVKLNWDQSPLYNDSCPVVDKTTGRRGYVGCAATSMAMIMAYHKNPVQGKGKNSYISDSLKIQCSANFGNTKYEWNLMPNSLTDSNQKDSIRAVATLMYHCGVSMNINYKPGETSGQDFAQGDPDSPCTENALKKYFGYDPSLREENRKDYTPNKWIELLKIDLDALRPIIYTGGSHSFICDGYDNNNKFHFNWGWGGLDNGYFSLDLLNPKENKGIYSDSTNAVLIGIKKNTTGIEDKNLSSKLVVYPNPTRGIVEIRLEKGLGEDLQKTTVTNLQGRDVYESYAKAENDRISVDLSANPQGNYIITCYFKSGGKVSNPLLLTK